MIFLQLWWALIVFSGHGSSQEAPAAGDKPAAEGSDKLVSFSRAVEQARPELQELKASFGGLQGQDNQKQPRDRRNTIDDMLASFAQVQVGEPKPGPEEAQRILQEAADAWFRDIQASMCKTNDNEKRSGSKQPRSAGKNYIDQHTKAMERTEVGKVKQKYKDTADDTVVRKYHVTKTPANSPDHGLTHLDIKLKQVQQMLSDQENMEAKKQEKANDVRKKADESSWVDKLPEFGDKPIPDGVYESTLHRLTFPHATSNKLAHEANYKLSKIEQEASEKATKYSRPGSISEEPVKQLKRSSCSGFNPMNEIKLKTSSRLMLKGLGPSLPSNALIDIHRNQMVDNILRRRELEHQQQQQQMESPSDNEEVDQQMGTNNMMTQNENLEYMQPVNSGMDTSQMMELPQSYDYRVPQYDRFHPLSQRQMTGVRDYERSNRMPLDLDRFKREPASESLDSQEDSILDSSSLEDPVLKSSSLKDEDQNISDHDMAVKMGILNIKDGSSKHASEDDESKDKDTHDEVNFEDLHDEVKLEDDALSNSESKLDSDLSPIEGKLEDKSEVETKFLGPVKRESKDKDSLMSSVKEGATLKDDTASAKEVKLKKETNSKREVPLLLDSSSEMHSNGDSVVASNSERQDNLEKRETRDSTDNQDSDCETECKSEEVEKVDTEAEKDDGIVKVNIKLKLQEPAEEKAECEETNKLQAKETAASPKVNPDAVVKLLANELSQGKDRGKRQAITRRLRRQNKRSKRSLDDNKHGLQEHQKGQKSEEQHVVAKRLVHLLDDFEDHNGNRAGFGNLGNGMLTADVEDSGGKTYPSHESLVHYNELEVNHDGDSLANIYDPTKEVVPMMNQRPNVPFQGQQQPPFQMQQNQPTMQMQLPLQQNQQPLQLQLPQQQNQQTLQMQLPHQQQQQTQMQLHQQQPPQQQQQQQQQTPSPQQEQQPQQQSQQLSQQQQQQLQQDLNRQRHQSSNFQASFNLTHFFNELQKLQNMKTPQQRYIPQQQPLQHTLQLPNQLPIERTSPQLPLKPVSAPIKSFGVHRYFGPFFNKQLKTDPFLAAMGTSTTLDPRCVSITPGPPSVTLPPNCTTQPQNTAAPTQPPAADQPSLTENVCNSPDAMKLNVSINANVCGDPKTKQFYGNGSISLMPAFNRLHPASNSDLRDVKLHDNIAQLKCIQDHPGAKEERCIREVGEESKDNHDGKWKEKQSNEKPGKQEGHLKRPTIRWSGMKQSNKAQPIKVNPEVHPKVDPNAASNEAPKVFPRPRIDIPDSQSDSYDKLITGKISEDIVSAVFEAVGNDPSLDRLLAVLERNRKCAQRQPKNFYQIRNDKNENYLQQTEGMVRDTMEAISDIIDQQVRRRACIPLRPDLQEFYDLIIKTSNEEQKCREKRQSSLQVLAEDFSQDVRLLDPSKINQKSRIVKKLLRQYEGLPMEDQQAAAGVRDELLLDLVYLRKLADSAERHQRNVRLQEVLKQTSLDEGLEKHMSTEYSPRFIKLLKTAELFKEAGEQQAKAFVGL